MLYAGDDSPPTILRALNIRSGWPVGQRVRRYTPLVPLRRLDTDNYANWSGATYGTLSADSTNVRSSLLDPRTSVKLSRTATGGTYMLAELAISPAIDIRNTIATARFRLSGTNVGEITYVRLRLFSGTPYSNNGMYRLYSDASKYNYQGDLWYDVCFPPTLPYMEEGTWDQSNITHLRLSATCASLTDIDLTIDEITFYERPKSPGRIFLTFDDGHVDNLPAARYLAAKGIRATFFVVANRPDDPPKNYMNLAQVKEIQAMGHLIGNHSWSHRYWHTGDLSEAEKRDEVFRAADWMIRNGFNRGAFIFALPGGGYQYDRREDEWLQDTVDLLRLGDSWGFGQPTDHGIHPFLNVIPMIINDSVDTTCLATNAVGLDTCTLWHSGTQAGIETFIDAVAQARDDGELRTATLDELLIPESAHSRQARQYRFALFGNLAVADNVTNGTAAVSHGRVVAAKAVLGTAPVGAAAIFGLNKNGAAITTDPNRLTVADGETTGETTTFSTADYAPGDIFTIDVEQVGSGTAGASATVVLLTEEY